ncbi:MAG: LAGLIDADG family homing endonuclease, partial [Candidatus Methylomirabilales bacterium]
LALVAQLEQADIYDWAANARPEQIEPDDYNIWLLMGGRGMGKLLRMDEPIPTPSGWTTMGALQVGDKVMDEHGQPCRVIGAYDTETPEMAYRFTFSDGATIESGSEHLWVTWTHAERKSYLRRASRAGFPEDWAGRPARSTQEIVDTVRYGTRGDRNHCIPTAEPLELPEGDLPIEPYLLGYWLGDGASAGASFTCGDLDRPHLQAAIVAAGYEIGRTRPSDPITFGVTGGLYVDLKALGLLKNKHTPGPYLRGSASQRLAVLAGLMDSDGYADKESANVEFSSTNPRLVLDVFELAVSLGQKPSIGHGRATINGRDCGDKWRVTWRPTINPFRLARKVERFRPPGAQSLRNRHRMIVSVEPVESVPMRCISVDSPNSMYLASRWMIPTHNTYTGSQTVRDWTENQ